MKTFTVFRNADESGVSGTGRILDGVIFHNGKVVICWRTDIDGSKHGDSSIGIYESFGAFRRIHIDSHPQNLTEIHYNPEANQTLNEIISKIDSKEIDDMSMGVTTGPEGKRLGKTELLRLKIIKFIKSKLTPIDKDTNDN